MLRPHHLSKNQLIWAVILMSLAVIIGIGLLFSYQINSSQPNTPDVTVTPGPITVEGVIVCLPHKDTTGPQTLECAFGLQSTSGDYYGLRNLNQDQLIDGTLTVSTKVKVQGEVIAPGDDERYGVVGNIEVKSIEVVQAAS